MFVKRLYLKIGLADYGCSKASLLVQIAQLVDYYAHGKLCLYTVEPWPTHITSAESEAVLIRTSHRVPSYNWAGKFLAFLALLLSPTPYILER